MKRFFRHSWLSGQAFYTCGVLMLFGLFAFQLAFHAVRASATNDEPVHLLAGYRYWQCGDFGINPEHPPLLKLLAAAPLLAKDLIQPAWECGSKITTDAENSLAGNIFLAKNEPDNMIIPARLAAALMSLLLAAAVFFAGREMFGRAEAVAALALIAFEPNLIAHGSLVTTDMALAATMFACVYAFYRYQKVRTVFRLLTVGLLAGLTIASKHSGIAILPILFLLLVAETALLRKSEGGAGFGKRIARHTTVFAAIVLTALVSLWAFYGFRYYALPNSAKTTLPVRQLLKDVSPGISNTAKANAIETVNRTRIFPESYTFGLAYVAATSPRPMFLLGEAYPTGRWFYFPVAFSIKTSAALLLLLPAGLLAFGLYRERRREMAFLLLPPVFFFALSLTSQMNIGVRHILQVYPFFAVVAAAGACFWARRSRFVRYALIVLLIYHAFAAFRAAPSYLAFSNDFWGGTGNTYRLLDDSNVDWGQNLKLVKEYLAEENINDCWIAAFGSGELVRSYQPCRTMPALDWDLTEQPIEPTPAVIEGTILISSWVLPSHGNPDYFPHVTDEYSVFLRAQPVKVIGGGIFVYRGRFEIPGVAALSRVTRARQLRSLNLTEEAITELRKAVELAPDKPHAHLDLGISLARANQREEAKREFEIAITLAQNSPQSFRAIEAEARRQLRRLR